MQYAGSSAAGVLITPSTQFNSNMPDQIFSLANILEGLQNITQQLRQKNAQLMFPMAEETGKADHLGAEVLPLISEVNASISRIDRALSDLTNAVDQTLTI